MNSQFDELAKAMAQPIARRAALKRFGVGAAVALLAAFGLAPRAEAGNRGLGERCKSTSQCQKGLVCVYKLLQPPSPDMHKICMSPLPP